MSDSTELIDRALALPIQQRAEMARRLLLSLETVPPEDQDEVNRLWSQEIDARIDRADAGGNGDRLANRG